VGHALVELIPIAVASAIAPLMVIIVLTFLRGNGGLLKASAFLCGVVAVRLSQGVVFGLLLGSPENADEVAEARTITATLLLVLGVLMLLGAVKVILKEEDPDESPPKWMTRIGSASALQAIGLGAFVITIAGKHWVFTLSALSVIREAEPTLAEGVTLFLTYVAVASLTLLTPILSLLIAPQGAANVLERMGAWMDANNRPIKIVVSAVFGVYFLWKGISAFAG
jgi:hypothetical protein